jgi:hypothetical protein
MNLDELTYKWKIAKEISLYLDVHYNNPSYSLPDAFELCSTFLRKDSILLGNLSHRVQDCSLCPWVLFEGVHCYTGSDKPLRENVLRFIEWYFIVSATRDYPLSHILDELFSNKDYQCVEMVKRLLEKYE